MAFVAAIALLEPNARAELVTNGGFETGDFSGWTTTDAPGTSSFYGVDTLGPHNGNYSAFFGASGPGRDSISQALATVAGQSYQISFFLDNSPGGDPSLFTASFGGITFFNAPTSAFAFSRFDFSVTATGSNSVLDFSGYNGPGFYTLDSVSVNAINANAVPEPNTLALVMISGLAFSTVVRRREKRNHPRPGSFFARLGPED